MRYKGFIGPAYQLHSLNADGQRCVGLFPEINESQQARPGEVGALVSTPGLRLLATIGSGPIRGLWLASWGTLYLVSGTGLYSVDTAWSGTLLGSLYTSTGRVGMADNGTTLVVVDGANGYDLTGTTFAPRSVDNGFTGGTNVGFLDGLLVSNQPGTQYFWISGSYTDAVDGLDFAAAEGSPDVLVTNLVSNRDLWNFGATSTEVFFDSGNADFPIERIQGAFIEHGCAAKWSPAKLDNTVFWLGGDERGNGTVWAARGYQPQRISTHAIEIAIQGYSRIDDATAYTYQQDGHGFYVLNFPSGGTTWVYDTATNLWHERVWLNALGEEARHRADCHAFAYGTHVVGDWETGNIYELDPDTLTDNGDEILRLRTAPHLTNELNRVFYHSFQLDAEAGTGTDGTNQGNDPQLMLQWSDDGGHSWSNEHWVSLGKIGQTKARAIWRRLGQSRDRVFRVKMTDPARLTIFGAEINATPGSA